MTLKKINGINIRTTFLSVMLIVIATFFMTPVFAQNDKDTTKSNSSSNGDDTFNQMLDYSRPGKYHQLLADLVGLWTFKGKAFSGDADSNKVMFQFNGTAVRKSFANGRFFIVTGTGGVLEMPIQNGKMKKVNSQEIITEGYDNVKNKFEQISIGNHIGSDILYSEGYYDSTRKIITFDYEEELVPGTRDKDREVFVMIDKDHYI